MEKQGRRSEKAGSKNRVLGAGNVRGQVGRVSEARARASVHPPSAPSLSPFLLSFLHKHGRGKLTKGRERETERRIRWKKKKGRECKSLRGPFLLHVTHTCSSTLNHHHIISHPLNQLIHPFNRIDSSIHSIDHQPSSLESIKGRVQV